MLHCVMPDATISVAKSKSISISISKLISSSSQRSVCAPPSSIAVSCAPGLVISMASLPMPRGSVDVYPALNLGFCRSAGSCSHEGKWNVGAGVVSAVGAVEERSESNHSASVLWIAEAVREIGEVEDVEMEAVRPGML
jgi:hypothetical protein